MAESEGQERTEQPTAKRLREARERGQVPRSRELGGAVMLGASILLLSMSGGPMMRSIMDWLKNSLTFSSGDLQPTRLLPHVGVEFIDMALIVAPLFIAGVVAAVVAPMFVSGVSFSSKALMPDFSRVNPMSGFKRLYSAPALADIAKAVIRVLLVGAVGWIVLRSKLPSIVHLLDEPAREAIPHGGAIAIGMLFSLTFVLVGIAAIDVPYQIWQHRRQLRMTREEVRDEMKESDGRPEVKARIRRMQHQLSNRRMLEAVPKADAVIVNPTHYAVAIVYEAGNMKAPKVVAKGVDTIAAAIRDVAEKHKVPIVSAPPLARALYRQVELNREVPVKLYAAVAQILSFVYQLKNYRRYGGKIPQKPAIELPGE
jgi:flagellar biosynthetic protein FlhB